VTTLAAVAAMAIGVAVGTVEATAAATSIRGVEQLEAGGGAGNARTRVIDVGTNGDVTPRAGYMVGTDFLGFLPE
jgi:hypothetical protein